MKKIGGMALITLFILSGCIGNSVVKVDDLPKKKPLPIEENIFTDPVSTQVLNVEAANFQFMCGWLSDEEIAYVENEENQYKLKSFNIHTEEINTLVVEEERITDVLIHPSKELLLLHTGNETTSATIKIFKTDGSLQNELTIDSTELAIEWNAIDPTLIALTAFHEDWSYDLFLYERDESELTLLPRDGPFPIWISKNELAFEKEEGKSSQHNDLLIYNPLQETYRSLELEATQILGFHDNQILTMANLNDQMSLVLRDENGQPLSDWIIPPFSEQAVPQVEWISTDELILYSPENQSVDKNNQNNVVHVKKGGAVLNSFQIELNSLSCSPSGQVCIIGENAQSLIWLSTGEQKKWLNIIE